MNENNNKYFSEDYAKLKWACRRGMLELDVLLGNFLQEAYFQLSSTEKNHFIELLTYPDPEIFSWLMGRNEPPSSALIKMIEKVRDHARSRI